MVRQCALTGIPGRRNDGERPQGQDLRQHHLEPARVRPSYSHCDRGPASRPIRMTTIAKELNQCLGLACHLDLADDLAAGVQDANAAFFQRNVDPCGIRHDCPPMMRGAEPFGPLPKPSLLENRRRQSFLAEFHYRIYDLRPDHHGSDEDVTHGTISAKRLSHASFRLAFNSGHPWGTPRGGRRDDQPGRTGSGHCTTGWRSPSRSMRGNSSASRNGNSSM